MLQTQARLFLKTPLALLFLLCWCSACSHLLKIKRKTTQAQGPKHTWKQERPLCEGNIRGVWGPALGRSLFAYGEFGAILRSDDKGASWRRLDTGTNRDLYSFFGSLSGELFVVGAEGTALSSQDDGETWEQMNVGDVKALRAITGAPRTSPTPNIDESSRLPERLFIVGDEGLVLLSEDGKSCVVFMQAPPGRFTRSLAWTARASTPPERAAP